MPEPSKKYFAALNQPFNTTNDATFGFRRNLDGTTTLFVHGYGDESNNWSLTTMQGTVVFDAFSVDVPHFYKGFVCIDTKSYSTPTYLVTEQYLTNTTFIPIGYVDTTIQCSFSETDPTIGNS